MKTNYGKMVIGVVIGIMAALTLTLNVWGTEWYKVVTSTIVGVIIGILISDYRVTVTIFKTGLQTAANSSWKRAQRIRNGEISQEQQHEVDVSIIKGLYVFLILFLIVVLVGLFIAIIYGFKLTKIEEGLNLLIMMPVLAIFATIYILIVGSLEFDNWVKRLNAFQVEKIWNKKPNEHGGNPLDYDYQTDRMIGFEELTASLSFKEIINKSLASAKVVMVCNLKNYWKEIKGFFGICAIIIMALTLFITTSLPVLPIWIIKQISKHGHLLNVAASITVGSVMGTLMHSQLIGLGSGLGFLAVSYLIEKLFKEDWLFYFFRGEGAFCKLAEKLK